MSPKSAHEAPSALRQFIRRAARSTLPRRLLSIDGQRREGLVYITFDDGPHPVLTPRLLDALKQLQVKATFFVIGERAEAYPNIVRRMIAEGHAIGGHSYTHSDPRTTSARRFASEIRQTNRLLGSIAGEKVRLMRPPHGKLTLRKLAAAWRARQTVVLWNSDPKDFAMGSADELIAWFRSHPMSAGDLILFHDTHPHALGALPMLVRAARDRSLEFGTPMDWFGSRNR